jgi:hypothetical protein
MKRNMYISAYHKQRKEVENVDDPFTDRACDQPFPYRNIRCRLARDDIERIGNAIEKQDHTANLQIYPA